jgi:MFS family permease
MGGNISVASAGMADITSEKDRAKGMGMIGAGIGLGFVFGPPIGGMLSSLDLLSIFPFFSNLGVTIFSGSALISVIISLMNFLLIAFFLEESHKPQHDKEKFSHPVLRIFEVNSNQIKLISLINFTFILGFSGFEFSINFFFHDVLQFTPKQIGFSFVYMGFLIILIQGGVIRRISGKIKEKKIAIFGTILLFIGFLILLFAKSVFMSFLSLTFLSIGSAFLNPSISSLASLFSSSLEQGKNLGLIRGIGSLARGFSPILFSVVYFQVGPNQTFLASIFLIMLVFIFLLKIKNPETMNDYK